MSGDHSVRRSSIGGRQRGDSTNNYTAESEALDQIAKQASEVFS